MKAIFLDRDGVINQTIVKMGKPRAPYSMEEFRFIDGVPEATQELKKLGYLLIVVTNQPDVSRGWVTMDKVIEVNQFVEKSLQVDEIYACFHDQKDMCECRKPKPGMILAAAKKWNIDLSLSFMIGDRESDVEAGVSAGCRTIFISDTAPDFQVDYYCSSLLQASYWIKRMTLN